MTSSAAEPPVWPQSTALEWRPLEAGLVPVWHPLRAALQVADDAADVLSADDLLEELTAAWLDPARDTVIGFDATGVARAFALIDVRPGDITTIRALCAGGVHPKLRGQGIGRALLDWQRQRALEIVNRRRQELGAQVPGVMWFDVPRGAAPTAALLTHAGARATRTTVYMRRPLGPAVELHAPPAGVTIVPFDPALDDQVRVAHNTTFAQQWRFQPWTVEAWQHQGTGLGAFRPGWSFVALAGDQLVGYVMCEAYPDEWALRGWSQGYVARLGTLPDWQGRGIGAALLTRAMTAFAADGMQYAGLDVDVDNPSGASRLYVGLGFEEWHRASLWELPL